MGNCNLLRNKMKFFAIIAAAAAIKVNKPSVLTSGEEGIYRLHPYTYTYNDIRDKELKCISDRNREWHYYANNNTWECPLKAYPRRRIMTQQTKAIKMASGKGEFRHGNNISVDRFDILL